VNDHGSSLVTSVAIWIEWQDGILWPKPGTAMFIPFHNRLLTLLVCFLLTAGLASFVSHPLLQAETASAERIGMLVKQLGSEDFVEREAATTALADLGESARAALEKAVAVSRDPELLQRATELIEKLDKALYRELKGHHGTATSVAFSQDGNYALSGGHDQTLRLWDLQTGKEVRVFSGHGSHVYGVAFCPDGKRAISCSGDRTLRLWDVRTGKELRCFKGHNNPVYTVTLSADGKRALSGGNDKSLRLWDLETGKELRRFEGHTEAILAVALSPDGKRALSGSRDNTAVVWDVETGKELRAFKGHTQPVQSVTFSPDGKRALSGSSDGTIRL
jgi:WD40 repeat protein